MEELSSDANTSARELATLGGGCFWCLEPIFSELHGVEWVRVGYAGGWVPQPTYAQVCTGTTGHAEVVHIGFDPCVITFRDLLMVFFSVHDPTTLNRQGADVGTQYRSVIFYHSDAQRECARQVIEEIEALQVWQGRIVTEVTPFTGFYEAEAYHQEYFKKNPDQAYCRVVIQPKLNKFRAQYTDQLKKPGIGA